MNEASFDKRVALYKAHYAMSMLGEAWNTLCYIRDHEVGHGHKLLHQLWTAFYVTYAKPFSQLKSHQRESYTAAMVAEEHRVIHDEIYSRRDQMFAHADRNCVDANGKPMNLAIVEFPGNGLLVPGFQMNFPKGKRFNTYLDCVESVKDKMSKRFNEVYAEICEDTVVDTSVTYQINTDKDDNRIFVPYA